MTGSSVERLTIAGPAGSIEAAVENTDGDTAARDMAGRGSAACDAADRDTDRDMPDHGPTARDPTDAAPSCYAVICHPHPLYAGTMENKVVTSLGKALRETGIPSVRFNFRGVGRSEGAFDAGVGETQDAEAVAAWGALRWPGRVPVIAGFSFGAYVALRLAQTRRVARLITVAPPVERFDFTAMTVPNCPWLVVQGDADELVDSQSVIRWVRGLKPPPTLVVMPGVGHFFHGRLLELRQAVIDYIRRG